MMVAPQRLEGHAEGRALRFEGSHPGGLRRSRPGQGGGRALGVARVAPWGVRVASWGLRGSRPGEGRALKCEGRALRSEGGAQVCEGRALGR